MSLPPIGQPPEENCYDYLYASKAAIWIEVQFRVSFRVTFRVVNLAFLACYCEATFTL